MADTYGFICDAQSLRTDEKYTKLFEVMFHQTIEAGKFIESYATSKYGNTCSSSTVFHYDSLHVTGIRAIQAILVSADEVIASFQQKFAEIKAAFNSVELLQVRIEVYSIASMLKDLGKYTSILFR